MRFELGRGSAKLSIIAIILLLSITLGSAATYLPSTKYINIQTEFNELTITLEKFANVEFIAHCPNFSVKGCPSWDIYNTNITQNATHITFTVYDKGAYIGVHTKVPVSGKNLSLIKDILENKKNITILKLNLTDAGYYLEFKLPLKKKASIKQVKDAVIALYGLKNETGLKNVERVQLDKLNFKGKEVEIKTDVVALEATNFTTAELKLPKQGYVNKIMKCTKWDFNTSNCDSWVATNIHFKQDNDYVYFNVTSFSAYAGVELTVLNVQSYPQVGGYWTVRLLTEGKADLNITDYNSTVYGEDIEFDSLMCGDKIVNVTKQSNGIFVANYSCNLTTYYRVKVLTAGKHTQRIQFDGIVKFVRNLANNMPNTLAVEGKLTNSTDDNQNGYFNITFRIYNVPTGGTPLWEENKNNVYVDDGVFSVILGTNNPLQLSWNEPYYLELQIENDNNMTPRINLTSTPYSKSADRAFNLSCTDCIDETQIDTSGEFVIEGVLNVTSNVINMHNHRIINLAGPSDDNDAATKQYVDNLVSSQGGTASGWNDTGTVVKLLTSSDSVNVTTLYINNAAGKVGIGTYNPSEKLTVVGNVNVTGNITSSYYAIKSTTQAVVIAADKNKKLIFTTNESKWV